MSAAANPDLDKATVEPAVVCSPFAALVATVTALVAAVLALWDLFAHGFWPSALHLAVALAVFGAVRLCVGLTLDPFCPPDLHDDAPESST